MIKKEKKRKKAALQFWAFVPSSLSTIMSNTIVNQCCAVARQTHAVPTSHPAFKRYTCLPSVVI